MKTEDLLREIKRLPINKRIYLIEKAIHSIREKEEKERMAKAADELYSDYKNDRELTAFTDIDFEDFYETK